MATLSFKDRVYTAIHKDYLKGLSDVKSSLQELAQEHLGHYFTDRNIKWEIEIVEHRMDIITNCFQRAHQWQPDWVEVWNIDFDVPKMLAMCERYGVDPADIFSDPRVPREYRYFWYRKGPVRRTTASGKVTPIKPAEQWHTVDAPASFQFIDGMQAYRHIRTGAPDLQSYAMDAIMDLEINLRKLRFKEGSHIREGSADWHIYMQKHARLQYVIYNVFDCIGLELLDEKTRDLAIAQPIHAGASDLKDFNSQPRRKVNELHFFLLGLEEPRVIGTTSDQMRDEIDDLVYPLSGWIVMLPAVLTADNGLCVIKEHPNLKTNVRLAVADLDIKSSYPTNGASLNISKETTRSEMISIEGKDPQRSKFDCMNLLGGHVNAIPSVCNLFDLPNPLKWLELFDQEQASAQVLNE